MNVRRLKPTIPSTFPLSFPCAPSRACKHALPGSGTAEPVLEQVVRLQRFEHPAALAFPIAKYLRDGELSVVIEDRERHAAKEPERLDMTVAEGLGRLRVVRL